MKRNIFNILIFIVSVSLLTVFSCGKKNENKIKIGAILPLTGDASVAGINTKEGIDLAIEKVNKEIGNSGSKIEVIYEDTKGDPKLGVSAVNKLIGVDKVKYIIDNSISSITLAVAPIVEKEKVILLATGASAPAITNAGQYVFRIWNSDILEGKVISQYVRDTLNIRNICILYAQSDFGIGLNNAFVDESKDKLNIKSFEIIPGNKDYNSVLSRVLNEKPDALYLVAYSEDIKTLITELKQLNYKGIIIGTSVMLDPSVQKIISENKFKLYFPSTVPNDTSSTLYSNFVKEYNDRFKKQPSALSDVGYDAVMLLNWAIKNNEYSSDIIIKKFNSKTLFKGASGDILFDENGDVNKPIKIISN
jgi:branched-chain amino acid transport system substrate-binding protein